ncbi:MAG: ECF transporter S component [Defluviitaleaceae bacterium]|nr:ECF transporter S component [Defluviitaleaceae bacterium]
MKTRDVILAGLFIALVFLATMFLRIPSPDITGAGQVHLGTMVVFVVSVVFGPKMGAVSSLGMVLFNLMAGLVPWAPVNLVARPVMALIFGYVAHFRGAGGRSIPLNILAAVLGGIWLVPAMYVGQVIMFQVPWAVPAVFMANNAMQIAFAIIIGLPLNAILRPQWEKIKNKR